VDTTNIVTTVSATKITGNKIINNRFWLFSLFEDGLKVSSSKLRNLVELLLGMLTLVAFVLKGLLVLGFTREVVKWLEYSELVKVVLKENRLVVKVDNIEEEVVIAEDDFMSSFVVVKSLEEVISVMDVEDNIPIEEVLLVSVLVDIKFVVDVIEVDEDVVDIGIIDE
jgi:hypothetical protein